MGLLALAMRNAHAGSGADAIVLPTAACPHAIVTAPDGTRLVLLGEQIWRRGMGDADTWRKVPVPAPCRPRELAVLVGRVVPHVAGVTGRDGGARTAGPLGARPRREGHLSSAGIGPCARRGPPRETSAPIG